MLCMLVCRYTLESNNGCHDLWLYALLPWNKNCQWNASQSQSQKPKGYFCLHYSFKVLGWLKMVFIQSIFHSVSVLFLIFWNYNVNYNTFYVYYKLLPFFILIPSLIPFPFQINNLFLLLFVIACIYVTICVCLFLNLTFSIFLMLHVCVFSGMTI